MQESLQLEQLCPAPRSQSLDALQQVQLGEMEPVRHPEEAIPLIPGLKGEGNAFHHPLVSLFGEK